MAECKLWPSAICRTTRHLPVRPFPIIDYTHMPRTWRPAQHGPCLSGSGQRGSPSLWRLAIGAVAVDHWLCTRVYIWENADTCIAFGPQAAWTTARQCMSSMSGSAMCRYVLCTICNYIYKIGPWRNKRGRETMPRLRLCRLRWVVIRTFQKSCGWLQVRTPCMYMIHSQWLPM